MSTTYVAWNGQSYPWPPPDGWYEGSDGRWWAPGSGPEAARTAPSTAAAEEPISKPEADAEPSPGPVFGTESGSQATAGLDRADKPNQVPDLEPDPGPDAGPDTGGRNDQTTVLTDGARNSLPTFKATAEPGRPLGTRLGDQPAAEDRNGSPRIPMVLAGGALLLMLATGLGYLAVRDDGSEISTPAATNTDSEPTTTTAIDQSALSSTTAPGQRTATTTTEAEPSDAPVTTEQDADATAPPQAAPALSPEVSLRISAWREDLGSQGIDSSRLSDADIAAFGNAFCVFALVSVDLDEFNSFRDRAQDGVAGQLTEEQLNAAIDSAVIAFCPDDAARLGVRP